MRKCERWALERFDTPGIHRHNSVHMSVESKEYNAGTDEEWVGITQEEVKKFAWWGLGLTGVSALGWLLTALLDT